MATKAPTISHRYRPLLPRRTYLIRMARSAGIAGAIMTASLAIGMVGYHGFEGMSWLDSFVNASMILAGMGPANELHTTGGKIFAGCYAIFSGVIFLSMTALLLAPMAHRFLHRMHLEIEPEVSQKA
jgi:hypothetical protein